MVLWFWILFTKISSLHGQGFEIGTYILTQYALDDAPTRYATWIQQALNELNNQTLYDTGDCTNNCWWGDYCYNLILTQAIYNFAFRSDSLELYLTDYGFHTGAIFDFSIATPVYASGYVGKGPFCWHETNCRNDIIKATAVITTSANISIIWNEVTKSATIDPKIAIIVSDPDVDYSACHLGFILSLFVDWFKDTIIRNVQQTIQNKINDKIAEINQQLNVPQTFSPYDGVEVTYNITNILFKDHEYAKLSATGILRAQNTDDDPTEDHTTWYTYKDISDADAHIAPPTNWTQSPFYQSYNNRTTGLYLLNGLRLSSTLFSALMWAAEVSGQLNPNYTYSVLDATLIFRFNWTLPLMKIPKDGELLLELTYGTIDSNCYETGGDPTDDHTIIDFEVVNLTANGTIDIDSSTDTLVIDIDQFDLNAVNLSLKAPPIPLPENVIEAILKEMVNATVPYLNDWLDAHAFTMPPQIRDYLPNPQLTLVHQDINGSNTSEHGYAQLMSVCACADDALFTRCSNLQCNLPTITPDPTSNPSRAPSTDPTASPSQSPTMAPTVYVNYTLQPTSLLNGNYSIWMHLFDGKTMDYDGICTIQSVGDEQRINKLANTNGECVMLSGDQIYNGMLNRNYYALNMDVANNDILSISVFCNHDCSHCSYSSEEVSFGECYSNITVLYDHYSLMFLEFDYGAVASSEIVNNQTVDIDDYNSDICFGGNSKMLSNNSMIWMSYQYSTDCNSYSVSLSNFGPFDECTIQNGGRYNQLSFSTNSSNVNNTNYTYLTGCDSKCNASTCIQSQALQYDHCTHYPFSNISAKFIFSSNLSICGNEKPFELVNGTTPAPTPSKPNIIDISTTAGKIAVGTIISVVCITLITVALCVWKRRELMECFKTRCIPFIVARFNDFLSAFECSAGKLSQQEILETLAMGLCGAILIWQSDVWAASSPWNVFTIEAFEQLGIDMSYLEVNALNRALNEWTNFGSAVSITFACICFVIVGLRIILIKPTSDLTWTQLRAFILLSYIIMHFFVWVSPSMKTDFAQTIHIDTSNISNTSLSAGAEVINDIDGMMGFAFVGIFLSYLSNLVLFWLMPIPVACYIMCVIFIIRQFNDDNEGRFGFISYDIEKEAKVQLFTRLEVILCMLQGLSSIIQALPVIILYQSFGVDVGWIILWCLWWSFPMFLLLRLRMILTKYIEKLKHPQKYYRIRASTLKHKKAEQDDNNFADVEYVEPLTLKSLRKQLWVNISFFFFAFVITAIIALHVERRYAQDMDFKFIRCNITVTFIIAGIFTFCSLNGLFSVYQKRKNQDITIDGNMNTEMKQMGLQTASYQILKDTEEEKEQEIDEDDHEDDSIELEVPKPKDKKHKNTAWCYQCSSFCRWLMESKERANPEIYGERVLYRRFFLLIGTLTFGYSVVHQLVSILNTTVKEEVVHFLDTLKLDVAWPDDNNGGTIFDDAFELYNTARKVELGFAVASFGCFSAASLFDVCGRSKKGLAMSRYMCWLSILLLFISIISTALPNYLRDTDITEITPYCAPEFNEAIDLISGDIVGILCSALFTVTLLPVLIAVPPSLVRATFMVLHDSEIFQLNQHQIDSLVSIIIVASFLTPLLTFLPLLVFQQLMGDNITAILIYFGWIGPIFVSFLFKHRKYGIKYSLYLYLLWLWIMLGSLGGIAIYQFSVYGVPQYFIEAIQSLDFYMEFTAEVFLANVVISDFLYANIMAFASI